VVTDFSSGYLVRRDGAAELGSYGGGGALQQAARRAGKEGAGRRLERADGLKGDAVLESGAGTAQTLGVEAPDSSESWRRPALTRPRWAPRRAGGCGSDGLRFGPSWAAAYKAVADRVVETRGRRWTSKTWAANGFGPKRERRKEIPFYFQKTFS
jgi:hypothetical protein